MINGLFRSIWTAMILSMAYLVYWFVKTGDVPYVQLLGGISFWVVFLKMNTHILELVDSNLAVAAGRRTWWPMQIDCVLGQPSWPQKWAVRGQAAWISHSTPHVKAPRSWKSDSSQWITILDILAGFYLVHFFGGDCWVLPSYNLK